MTISQSRSASLDARFLSRCIVKVSIHDIPRAMKSARRYTDQLSAFSVPFSLIPEYRERDGKLIGVSVSVDVSGGHNWAQWVVLRFYEDGLHPPGCFIKGLVHTEFVSEGVHFGELALSLADARRDMVHPKIEDAPAGGFKLLKFLKVV